MVAQATTAIARDWGFLQTCGQDDEHENAMEMQVRWWWWSVGWCVCVVCVVRACVCVGGNDKFAVALWRRGSVLGS